MNPWKFIWFGNFEKFAEKLAALVARKDARRKV